MDHIKDPLVSCIIPVFNGERYLRQAINSILKQSYRPLEIIVVDDGSTDGTAELVKSYGQQITYLFQPNRGPGAARNLGLTVAKGELIAFIDADDLWHPEKLSRQVKRLNAPPPIDVCFTVVSNFWIPELIEEKKRLQEKNLVKTIIPFVPSSCLARRSLFETIGQFDSELLIGEDSILFSRMKDRGVANDVLREVLVYRRIHENNLTRGLSICTREEIMGKAKDALKEYR